MIQNNRNNKRSANGDDILNGEIRAREIIIINEDGSRVGPLSKREALTLAEEKGMDLLQVAVQPDKTVVAKILDYGKFKYQKQKRQKEAKKNQVETQNKEIRLTVGIGEHDLDTKARKAREFIEDGDRVKISLKFKGREIVYMDKGMDTLDRFYTKLEDIAQIEKKPKLNSRFLDMYIVPKKN